MLIIDLLVDPDGVVWRLLKNDERQIETVPEYIEAALKAVGRKPTAEPKKDKPKAA